jgi:hypothetical protein
MKTRFKIGDKVVAVHDPSYKGTVTKIKYVPKKGLFHGDFQWLYLDGSDYPAGYTSNDFKLDTDENSNQTNHC